MSSSEVGAAPSPCLVAVTGSQPMALRSHRTSLVKLPIQTVTPAAKVRTPSQGLTSPAGIPCSVSAAPTQPGTTASTAETLMITKLRRGTGGKKSSGVPGPFVSSNLVMRFLPSHSQGGGEDGSRCNGSRPSIRTTHRPRIHHRDRPLPGIPAAAGTMCSTTARRACCAGPPLQSQGALCAACRDVSTDDQRLRRRA